ncbi:LAMI_0E12860g1_1 [Lachancea mirantina]|uniref:LAMI_0E12860g1_1 n=1 Tax=Lachancea mirantina TaxID=1230905 RepID=A0A1G4JQU5_9SACH|nr:LAMI_0E12860g1_1 [Lachancea mirantina]
MIQMSHFKRLICEVQRTEQSISGPKSVFQATSVVLKNMDAAQMLKTAWILAGYAAQAVRIALCTVALMLLGPMALLYVYDAVLYAWRVVTVRDRRGGPASDGRRVGASATDASPKPVVAKSVRGETGKSTNGAQCTGSGAETHETQARASADRGVAPRRPDMPAPELIHDTSRSLISSTA